MKPVQQRTDKNHKEYDQIQPNGAKGGAYETAIFEEIDSQEHYPGF